MKILLIGGSGFVSGALARAALQAGHRVEAVTRGQRPLPAGVLGITADRADATEFAAAIEAAYLANGDRWDLVVDCICYEPQSAAQDIALFRDRAHHFVLVSTDFVYLPSARQFPQNEDNDQYLTDISYGANKRRCELEFVEGDTHDMRWNVVRPCHIYGPGSLLGCLPQHGRDLELLRRIRAGEALKLVGGGHFLQQPILAADLALLILSCAGNAQAHRQIYQTAGPDIVESREYYRIIAELLGHELRIEEIPVDSYLAANPEQISFLCHRIYNLKKLGEHGLDVPGTPLREGLRQQVAALVALE